MKNGKSISFSFRTVLLSVSAAVLADCILSPAAVSSVRTVLLPGLLLSLLVGGAAALAAGAEPTLRLFSGRHSASRLVCLLFALWFFAELVQTVLDAQKICWEQFSSMAVIGFLPLFLWAGWALDGTVFSRTARILWWVVLLGAGLCLWGLGSQLRWQNLIQSFSASELHFPTVPLYAEFFALPLLCPDRSQRTAVCLPIGAFLLSLAYGMGLELLFGAAEGRTLLGYELLRAWTLGAFSRFDAFLLLVWLAAALFRICFLTRVLRLLLRRIRGIPRPADSADGAEVQA